MSFNWSKPRSKRKSAAEKRRHRVDGGPLFADDVAVERALLELESERYRMLRCLTPPELEELAKRERFLEQQVD